ncbi:unnamed protein product [Discosporangium mesarthrocarpum]
MEKSCHLRSLNLARNGLGGYAGYGATLASLISKGVSITDLDLSDNNLSGDDAASIGKALMSNTVLKKLDLGWNRFGGTKAANALVEGLACNSTLSRLELCFNGVGESACVALAEALMWKGSGLSHLGIRGNLVGDRGTQALLQAMERGTWGGEGALIDVNEGGRGRHRLGMSVDLEGFIRLRGDREREKWGLGGRVDGRAGVRSGNTGSEENDFDPRAPNGDYRLQLDTALDRHLARQILELSNGQHSGAWINARLDRKDFEFSEGESALAHLPQSGVLCLTFGSSRPVSARKCPPRVFQAFIVRQTCASQNEKSAAVLVTSFQSNYVPTVTQSKEIIATFRRTIRAEVASILYARIPDTEMARILLEDLIPVELTEVEEILGSYLAWFSSTNPTCQYRLRLNIPNERLVAVRLAEINLLEKQASGLIGGKDLSQVGNHSNLRNVILNGEPFNFGDDTVIPKDGLLMVDYSSTLHQSYANDSEPIGDPEFQKLMNHHPVDLLPGAAEMKTIFSKFKKAGGTPLAAHELMTRKTGFRQQPSFPQVFKPVHMVKCGKVLGSSAQVSHLRSRGCRLLWDNQADDAIWNWGNYALIQSCAALQFEE